MANKIQIVGAGFSGLCLAYYLNKLGFEVTLFEKSSKEGGVLQTDKTPFGQVEKAARGVMNTLAFEELCASIDCPLIGSKPESKKRYIYKAGKLTRWPLSISSSLKLASSLATRRQSLISSLLKSSSVSEWAIKNLGGEVDRYLVSPALQGIFARSSESLSAPLIYKNFFSPGKKTKASVKISGLVYPEGGMQSFSKKLREYLENKGVHFRFGHKITHIDALSPPFVIATSATDAQGLGAISASFSISMQPVVVVNAFFQKKSEKLDGFGCLFPRGEGVDALGVVSNTNTFEGLSENHSETWIYSGDPVGKIPLVESDWIEKMLAERERVFAETIKPLYSQAIYWDNGIPAYDEGLQQFVEKSSREHGVYLFGNYFGKIGLGKIVAEAQGLAQRIKNEVGHSPR